MLNRKIFAVVAAVCIICGMSACEKNDVSNSQTDKPEIKTIELPKNGWTWEQLNEVIYINGINYDYLVTLETLLEKYSCDNEFVYTDKAGTVFYYNNVFAFGAGLEYEDTVNPNSKMISAIFSILDDESQIATEDLISINGLRLKDTYNDMIYKLGQPDISSENYSYKYIINENVAVGIYFFDSNEIQTIQVIWE